MKDPISHQDYETTIQGLKQWGAIEFPHGLPLLYALVGFVTISTIIAGLYLSAQALIGGSLPTDIAGIIPIFGVIWAFGGWQHGEKAQEEIEIDEWKY